MAVKLLLQLLFLIIWVLDCFIKLFIYLFESVDWSQQIKNKMKNILPMCINPPNSYHTESKVYSNPLSSSDGVIYCNLPVLFWNLKLDDFTWLHLTRITASNPWGLVTFHPKSFYSFVESAIAKKGYSLLISQDTSIIRNVCDILFISNTLLCVTNTEHCIDGLEIFYCQ